MQLLDAFSCMAIQTKEGKTASHEELTPEIYTYIQPKGERSILRQTFPDPVLSSPGLGYNPDNGWQRYILTQSGGVAQHVAYKAQND